jgi:hypothetical protein
MLALMLFRVTKKTMNDDSLKQLILAESLDGHKAASNGFMLQE